MTFTIGGSEAAAACEVDPYRSRVDLFSEKTGRRPAEPPSEAMEWGTLLEPVILNKVCELTGMDVWAGGSFTDEFRPWMTGHPDAFGRDGDKPAVVIDAKTTSGWGSGAWADGAAPMQYIVQLHHYMYLTGLDRGLLACLIGGQRLELRYIERDEKIIETMLAKEEEFVGFCERDEWPPPDGSSSTADAIRAMHPTSASRKVELDKASLTLVREIPHLDRQLAEVKRQRDARKQAIQLLMGDADEAVDVNGNTVAKWTTYQRDGKPQRRFTVT